MIKVFIADDHPIVLQGIRQMLSSLEDVEVVGEAGNGAELLDKLAGTSCNILIMDIKMPDRNGLELLQQIRHDYPGLAVLILSMYPEEQYGPRYLRAGAAGYLNKDSSSKELINAVRRVAGGTKYISPRLAEAIFAEMEIEHPKTLLEILSDREFEIFCKLAAGRKIHEIAAELFVSESTVRTYKSRILKKMHLKNEVELFRYALDHHLTE